jgi:glutamate carboxypeptidase
LLSDLEALVARESPSDQAGAVSALAAWIRDTLAARGVRARTLPCPPRGDALLAELGAGSGGTLLLGHLDTVWPLGTLAEWPFRIEGERAGGPGAFDMKGGIAVALSVLAELAAEGAQRAVTLLLVPDEEVGTAASRELLLEVARRQQRVLVLEPPQGASLKIARKGTGVFELRFSGRAAHAGLEPEQGASALLELARAALFLEGLADAERGTTVAPTVARAGSRVNVIPESGALSVDVRVWTDSEARRVEAALRDYRPADARVEITLQGGFDRPPLQPTPQSEALYSRARGIARELGFELGAARVGGASDGNLTAAAGVPTLDGMGPMGGGAHARDEHVILSDMPRRAALLARMLADPW